MHRYKGRWLASSLWAPIILVLTFQMSVSLFSCDASSSRGESSGCEESLRASLGPWNELVETLSEEASERRARLRSGQGSSSPPEVAEALEAEARSQAAQGALSMAAAAHVQTRVYGGDQSRNAAKNEDSAAAGRRASEAFERALALMPAPPDTARTTAQAVIHSCQ